MRVETPRGRVYRTLAAYAAGLTAEDFTRVAWPHADGSARTVYAHLVQTWVRKLGLWQVLIARERLDQPLKEVRYWATSDRGADLETVVAWAAQRWAIEPFFADGKEVFGSDQCQPRSAQGPPRLWHLVFLDHCYLEEQRAADVSAGVEPTLTVGQTRRAQQFRHRWALLCWLHSEFEAGAKPDQVYQPVAA